MSIKRMTAVWEHSQHSGTPLLLLLALADNANDEGYCWPTIDTLAQRTRANRRTVLRSIEQLEASGELIVHHNRRGNKYLVVVGMDQTAIEAACVRYFGKGRAALAQNAETAQSDTMPPQKWHSATSEPIARSGVVPPQKWRSATSEVTFCALDPSITVNDPSDSSAGSDDPALRAPADALLGSPPSNPPDSPVQPNPWREPETVSEETRHTAETPVPPTTPAVQSTSAPKQPQPLIAIVEAYWQGLPAPPAGKPYARSLRAAKRLHDAGYTPDQVLAYLRALYRDSYWRDKVVSLEYVADHLPTWLAAQTAPPPDDEEDDYSPYPTASGTTPETVEQKVWKQILQAVRPPTSPAPGTTPGTTHPEVHHV